MTQSFNEWFKNQYKCLDDEKFDSCEDAWNAGAQSLQAEVDELKKRIDDALKNIYFEQWSDEYGDFQTPTYNLIKILKGEHTK